MSLSKLLYIGTGVIFVVMAFGIFILANPFEQYSYYEPTKTTAEVNITNTETENEIQTAKANTQTTVHNYDTIYGDNEITQQYSDMCTDMIDSYFNIGFRSLTLSQDAYIGNAVKTFENGRVDYHSYRFDATQLASFIANMVSTNQMELEAKFIPKTQFSYDSVTVINGTMEINIHSGLDISELAKFLNISEAEFNTTYSVPVSFKYSQTLNQLVSFMPDNQTIE